MGPLHSPKEYLFNLQTTSSGEAKRLWRQQIKEKWNHQCAYCGSTENLTIDHVIPRSNGGSDFITNVVCCCEKCNRDKSHSDWEDWYKNKEYYTKERYDIINNWIQPKDNNNFYSYKPRKNICY